jgi:hypothetical protein
MMLWRAVFHDLLGKSGGRELSFLCSLSFHASRLLEPCYFGSQADASK